MKTKIDSAGRIVIPKALRERSGLTAGIEVRVEIDGAGLHIEAVEGSGLERHGRFLTVPTTGVALDNETVQNLRREDQR